MSEKEKPIHVGFKSFALMLSMILGVVWTLFEFFYEWLTATAFTPQMIVKYGIGLVLIYVIYLFLTYLAHMIWKLIYKIETKLIV